MPRTKRAERETKLRQYYQTLYHSWGAQHWWPAETRFEVIVGAYLTQNTAWTNVELALTNLRQAHMLSLEGIREVPLGRLERLIRSSGYFRQKAKRLKTFVRFLDAKYNGSLDQTVFSTDRQSPRRAAQLERCGSGDCRLDSSLRGKSSRLRRGCLHAPHPGAAMEFCRRKPIMKIFASYSRTRWRR